jgi:hypothetical protein
LTNSCRLCETSVNNMRPTPPHQHTLHNIEVHNRKKRQPFWGGESADSKNN